MPVSLDADDSVPALALRLAVHAHELERRLGGLRARGEQKRLLEGATCERDEPLEIVQTEK